MDELVAFLRARYDDDERVARAAKLGPWHVEEDRQDLTRWVANEARSLEVGLGYVGNRTQDDAAHIVRHDPARVLREVEAKRRTLVRCEEALLSASPMLVHFAQQTLREMCLPYADHPDRPDPAEWRP